MARQLHSTTQIPLSISQIGLSAMTLLLCAIALFMCASHSRKWRRWSAACYGSQDHDPVIQLHTETMMTTSSGVVGIQAGGPQDESMLSGEQGGSVWQKNILMGGKCQLPDFSGVIIYDSDGKTVTPAKNPRPLLTWK
ncbi:hypothetical protein Tsubulata_044380 [Turnera subulata]|uniref:Uncharacterized protein n=1 Tax=Turnera subulata TaxID=218843 RepID=A0A9Q0GFE0_9ROSI|nr:hypothetical protein Tsubulata_044380 [Turnera subulata]